MNEDKVISLTDAAAVAVKEILAQQTSPMYLRVYVSGGGCSGLKYGISLDEVQEDDDVTIEDKGIEIKIDPTSLKYMSGSVVDFIASEMGGGFKVDNPSSTGGCGCGKSFKTEESAPGGCGGCNSCG